MNRRWTQMDTDFNWERKSVQQELTEETENSGIRVIARIIQKVSLKNDLFYTNSSALCYLCFLLFKSQTRFTFKSLAPLSQAASEAIFSIHSNLHHPRSSASICGSSPSI